MNKFNHIDIIAKRWFQRTYGNTYHSVEIIVDGKFLDKADFAYGYDYAYMQTAHKLLAKHGIFDWHKTDELVPVYRNGKLDYHTPKEAQNSQEAYSQFIQDTREHKEKYTIVCSDVSHRKDL
jgi:hypothetical protein